MYSIAICLATYNGERYLAEQLDSLLSQDYKNIKVYIHDDGSSDGTTDIIQKYVRDYPDTFVFYDDNVSYKNAGLNFMETLKKIPKHDFYMFCDQDDVWLDDKVSKTLNEILKETDDVDSFPILAYTDLKIVDDKLNVLQDGIYGRAGYYLEFTSYESSVVYCRAAGCTTLFNHKSKELMFSYKYPSYDKAMYHDYWLPLCTLSDSKSKLVYLDEGTILYRQHSNNTVGHKVRKKNKSFPIAKTILCAINVVSMVKLYRKLKRMNKYLPHKISFLSIYMESVKMKYLRYKFRSMS